MISSNKNSSNDTNVQIQRKINKQNSREQQQQQGCQINQKLLRTMNNQNRGTRTTTIKSTYDAKDNEQPKQ